MLNSFLTRYENLDLETLNEEEFKNTVHTIKGLAATLGMEQLSHTAKLLNELRTEELVSEFSGILLHIMNDLKSAQTKSILIIDDEYTDIDILVQHFEESHDLIIAPDINSALESLTTEKIDIVLLASKISNLMIIELLGKKNIPIIYLHKPLNMPIITKKLDNI